MALHVSCEDKSWSFVGLQVFFVVTLESDFKYGELKDGEKYGGNLFFWKLDDILQLNLNSFDLDRI